MLELLIDRIRRARDERALTGMLSPKTDVADLGFAYGLAAGEVRGLEHALTIYEELVREAEERERDYSSNPASRREQFQD
jgi:hypothetical protein